MKEKELWMEKLKERFENYTEPAPASGWERLERELTPSAEKRLNPFRRWTIAAAAAVLVAVSSVSVYFLNTPVADEIRNTPVPSLAVGPDALPQRQQPEKQIAKVDPLVRPITNRAEKSPASIGIPVSEINTEAADLQPEAPVSDLDKEKKPVQGGETDKKEQSEEAPVSDTFRKPSEKTKWNVPERKPAKETGKWSMALSVGNTGGASGEAGGNVQSYVARVNLASVGNGAMMPIPNDQTLVFEEGIPYLRQVKDITSIKHRQPVSFGLSVRKGLRKGFSLETGLTYTLLASDVTVTGANRKTEQKLHYVGIPLRANWNFVDRKLFSLYIAGGGMVEKCVYGKLGDEKETVDPLQFSVNGAVGAQINATNRIGFYVEPGVSYFFNDGSNVQTIRKENSVNFNIQAGIRLSY